MTDNVKQDEKREANVMIGAGAAVGALGVGAALLVGAVCPACIVISPALIGTGIVRRIRAGKSMEQSSSVEEPQEVTDGKGM